MSSQPPMASPQNGILYTNEPSMSNHLHLKATFPLSQGWLLIAGFTVALLSIDYRSGNLEIFANY